MQLQTIRYAACSLLLFFVSSAFCQVNNLQEIQQKIYTTLEKYHDDYPREKAYVQTDRNIYAAGETIWMKAWLTYEGKPSPYSRVFYIDLVNDNGIVIEKKMYKLDSMSSTPCDLTLGQNLAAGSYRIRAYTLWMLNFTQDVFTATIFITDKKVQSAPITNNSYHFAFYPEGGYLVDGLESVIGCKITDQNGVGQNNLNVTIKNNKGTIITTFITEHDGMGSFVLTPQSGDTYTASLKNDVPFALPIAEKEGIVLKVSNTSKSKVTVIAKKNTVLPGKYNNLLIVAQMHSTVVFTGVVNFAEGASAAAISKKNLPPGVMQITLFDETGMPLAERVVFINNIIINPLEVKIEASNNESIKEHTVLIKAPEGANPNLSICIVKEDALKNNQPESFLSSLFLSSDISGDIENPNYYFSATDSNVNRHMDLLMLTQGWRRYKWKELLHGEQPQLKYIPEQSLVIKGNVTTPGSNNRITTGKVDMFIKGADSTTLYSVANLTDRGEFIFENLNIKKDATIYYQGTNTKNEKSHATVNIYPAYIDTLKKTREWMLPKGNNSLANNNALAAYFNQYFTNDSIYKALQGITVTGNKKSALDSLNNLYTTGQFTNGGRQINVDGHYFTIWQLMRTIPGFSIEGNSNSPTVTVKRAAGINVFSDQSALSDAGEDANTDMSGYVENGIAYYLNEVPVSKDIIDGISMNDVAYIKTYIGAETAVIGPFSGVISVYTKMGTSAGNTIIDKSFARQKILGYSVPREFSLPILVEKNSPSIQPTLLWIPNVRFSKKKEFLTVFNSSPLTPAVKLLIQGLDKSGRLFYHTQVITK